MEELKSVVDKILLNSKNKIDSAILINNVGNLKVIDDRLEYEFRQLNKDYKLLSKFDKFNLDEKDVLENLTLLISDYN